VTFDAIDSRRAAPRLTRWARALRPVASALWACAALSTLPRVAAAVEVLDGLIEAHGAAEIQIRALDSEFSEELDLAQWYNVFSLETDLNFAPDGFGPVDLLTGFVKVEIRYDCVYTRGCGMLRSADTYGNRAKRLPTRLRNASDPDFSGAIPPITPADLSDYPEIRNPGNGFVGGGRPRHPQPTPSRFEPYRDADGNVIDDSGYPGADTFFRSEGPDSVPNSGDEPARYTFEAIADYRFAFKDIRDQGAGGTSVLGPWLPKNRIQAIGLLSDRANSLRGRFAPTSTTGLGTERFHVDDLVRAYGATSVEDAIALRAQGVTPSAQFPGIASAARFDNLHPELLSLLRTDSDPANCVFPNVIVSGRCFTTKPDPSAVDTNGNPLPGANRVPVAPVSEYFISRANTDPALRIDQSEVRRVNAALASLDLFGGDWNPRLPCRKPSDRRDSDGYRQRLGGAVGRFGNSAIESGLDFGLTTGPAGACLPDGAPDPSESLVLINNALQFPTNYGTPPFPGLLLPGIGTNRRITGGAGENPLRPAPELSNLGSIDPMTGERIDNSDFMQAQGLYYPSVGLREELARGELNDLDFNFTQTQRALNRGQSQRDYKELKEAYLEVELLDSRLWIRLGLQNIVWGKTELFRTTDQFNPVDLALASLPTLEEQRIALWSGRAVYSFYDVGPFNDVRAEIAFNWDRFQPNDLGACGEPFTPDIVCTITFGAVAHGMFGVGIAGVDRPPKPWNNLSKGVEYGGRVEWRWDRFSFALSDFYGYDDTPFPDMIFSYDRNVDPLTGRPRVARATGRCDIDLVLNPGAVINPRNARSNTIAGIGTDSDCLKAGPAGSPQNALEYHHANQQLFAVLCSGTTSLAAALDAGACAFNVFASRNPLVGSTDIDRNDPDCALGGRNNPNCSLIFIFPPFVELLSAWFAGDPGEEVGNAMGTLQGVQFIDPGGGSITGVPTRALNRDDGRDTLQSPVALYGPTSPQGDGSNNFTYQQFRLAPNSTIARPLLSIDSTLTSYQRALFGCGPFYGTRCDSSVPTPDGIFPAAGGLDFLNAEASAVTQSWPGVEGTHTLGLNGWDGRLWTTTDRALTQPGTAGFDGGPVCTRRVGGRIVTLPGCRGVATPDELRQSRQSTNPFVLEDNGSGLGGTLTVVFQDGYSPGVDGCVFAPELFVTSRNPSGEVFAIQGRDVSGRAVDLSPCTRSDTRLGDQRTFGVDRSVTGNPLDPDRGMLTQFHPLAGCFANPTKLIVRRGGQFVRGDDGLPCPAVRSFELTSADNAPYRRFQFGVDHDNDPNTPRLFDHDADPSTPPVEIFVDLNEDGVEDTEMELRNYQNEWFNALLPDGHPDKDPNGRTASVFRSEAAAVSWNILMLLVASSCNDELDNRDEDLDCFDYRVVDGVDRSYLSTRCSFAAPQLCRNTKGFLSIAGVTSRRVAAAGNGRFGRRTFAWHGGQEAVLRYQRRNVFGFSSDFAEDMTKTNWGMEFTWINDNPYADGAAFDGITNQDTLNLTISVDRPTFINFLNANRTFFFNSQWFIQYQTNHRESFNANGPWNVLFTTAIQTGYYQDRLQPELITVYDFNSRSGAILPSIGYRFTDAFSIRWGFLIFFGRTEFRELGINPIGPPVNRADPNAYQVPVENALSLVRDRDEVFVRLRYTF
jgi:hypothetical protein